MRRSTTIVLALGVVLAGIGLWSLGRLGGVHSTETGAGPAPAAPAPAGIPVGLANAPSDERVSSIPAPIAPTSDLPVEARGTIAGTVVDSRNHGLGGVEVRAVLDVARDSDALDPEAKALERVVARTSTGSDGRFSLEVAAGRAHELRASAAGFSLGVAADVRAGEHPTILLRHGATLSGTARRKQDGRPVQDARVFLISAGGGTTAPAWEGSTDEKGAYLAEDLPAGAHILYVVPKALGIAGDRVDLAEGETRKLDVSLPEGTTVLGEVTDAVSGAPIAGAEVSASGFLLVTVRSDEAGKYQLVASGDGVGAEKITVAARAPSYGVYEVAAVPQEGGVIRADFALAKGRAAHGRVVSRAGAPIAGAIVVAWASRMDGAILREGRRTTRTGDDGRFRLPDLRTDLPVGIVVRKERFAQKVEKVLDAGLSDDFDLGDVVLCVGTSLEGSVATPAGDPVRGADVTLAPESRGDFEASPLERYATTDAQGVFRFADLGAGSFRIDVEAQGIPTAKEGWKVVLSEGESKQGFRIVVGAGRSIAGRVIDSVGLGVDGAEIELSAPGSAGWSLRGLSAADGTFQLNGLDADTYDVEARFREEYGPPGDRHHLVDARVAKVAAGTTDLVVELRRAAEIVGRVAGLDGDPEHHPFLLAVGDDGRRIAGEHLQPHGRFVLRVPANEYVELRAWADAPESITRGPGSSDPDHPPQAVRAGVRGGDADVVLVLKP